MRGRPVIHALALITLVGSALLAYFSDHEWPASPDRARHAALGRTLAQEALRLLKPGTPLVLIAHDTQEFKHPEAASLLRGFESTLREAGVAITTRHSVEVDPLRALEVPSGDFFEILRKMSAGGVVVSFLGPPILSPEQRARLGEVRCAVVAFCPGATPRRTNLRALLESGLVTSALVETTPRSRLAAEKADRAGGGHTPYALIHATDAASLGETTSDSPAP